MEDHGISIKVHSKVFVQMRRRKFKPKQVRLPRAETISGESASRPLAKLLGNTVLVVGSTVLGHRQDAEILASVHIVDWIHWFVQ